MSKDNIVTMYKGIDPIEGELSLLAVKGVRVAPASFVDGHSWMTQDGFGEFSKWCSIPSETDELVLAKLHEFEIIWQDEDLE